MNQNLELINSIKGKILNKLLVQPYVSEYPDEQSSGIKKYKGNTVFYDFWGRLNLVFKDSQNMEMVTTNQVDGIDLIGDIIMLRTLGNLSEDKSEDVLLQDSFKNISNVQISDVSFNYYEPGEFDITNKIIEEFVQKNSCIDILNLHFVNNRKISIAAASYQDENTIIFGRSEFVIFIN